MKNMQVLLQVAARAGLIGGLIMSTGAAWAQARFTQDRFAIGFWVDPPADEKMDQRYREIAEANFTVVLGGFSASKEPSQVQKQLELCQKYGLKVLVRAPGEVLTGAAAGAAPTIDSAQLPEGPACWGYLLRDEPPAEDFPGLAKMVDMIREKRPGRLAYINLLPNYGTPKGYGTPTYEEHVRRFIDEVKPDVLSMDHYPIFRPGEPDGRDKYCENLAVMREESLRAGIPYWNFFNTMPYGPHTDPTEDQLRWQIYATVAYGAKGVLYFCYYTPLSEEFPKGGAILQRNDRYSRHYEQAKRLNGELKNLGPMLMQLTSTKVARVKPEDNATSVLQGMAIRNLSGAAGDPKPNYLVGEFKHADGRRAVLLQNYNFAYTAWPTVEFDVPKEKISEVGAVQEVDKTTGQLRPVIDDSPDMDGLQISLDAGEGRLFVLPAK